jgi:sugar (pentulose or hexulose) kinase
LYVCGGGSNSATWLQMFADVLQHPLKVARRPEVGARGAAMAAMQAAGYGFDPVEWTEPETTIQPNPAVAKLYKTGFDTYMSLIKAIQPTWRPKQ